MKPSRTSLYGGAAAVCFAAGQVPNLPGWMSTAFNVGAAISMAMLGRHAADCPANCPGTDAQGRPHVPTRIVKVPITGLAVLISSAVLLCSCVSPNPAHTPDNPTAPAYVVDPGLSGVSNAAVQLAREVGDVSQTGPVLPMLVTGIFTAVAGISALVAQHRSHRAALAEVARSKQPPATTPLDGPPVNG